MFDIWCVVYIYMLMSTLRSDSQFDRGGCGFVIEVVWFWQAARLVRGSFGIVASSRTDSPELHTPSPSHQHNLQGSRKQDVWPQSAAAFYSTESTPQPQATDEQSTRRGSKSNKATSERDVLLSSDQSHAGACSGDSEETHVGNTRPLNEGARIPSRNARGNAQSWSPPEKRIVVVSNAHSQRSEPTQEPGLGEWRPTVPHTFSKAPSTSKILKSNKTAFVHAVQAVDDVGGSPHGLTHFTKARRPASVNIWPIQPQDDSSSAPTQPFESQSSQGSFDGHSVRQPRSPPKQSSLRLLHVYDRSKSSPSYAASPNRTNGPAEVDPNGFGQYPILDSRGRHSGAGSREILDVGPRSIERGSRFQKQESSPRPSDRIGSIGSLRASYGRGQERVRDWAQPHPGFPPDSKPPVHHNHQPPNRHRAHVHRTPQQQGYVAMRLTLKGIAAIVCLTVSGVLKHLVSFFCAWTHCFCPVPKYPALVSQFKLFVSRLNLWKGTGRKVSQWERCRRHRDRQERFCTRNLCVDHIAPRRMCMREYLHCQLIQCTNGARIDGCIVTVVARSPLPLGHHRQHAF